MRLTCPNCGAQYEVPDAVIPAAGRDVQCSNCGTTWFHHHPDHAPPETNETDFEPEREVAFEPETSPEPEPEARPEPGAGRRLDPSVADILREEADRERAARAAEGEGRIETQPDLGLGEPEPDQEKRAREARDRMQRLRGERPDDTGAPSPRDADSDRDEVFDDDEEERLDPGSRRNLFPDIDKINSSLSATNFNDGALTPAVSEEIPVSRGGGGGFRAGFRLAVVTCVLALVVYLMAPRIAGIWPAAEGPLAQYVQAVDEARATFSQTVASLLARL